MSQSLCARCLDPMPPGHQRNGNILCNACESAWRTEFNRSMNHHLARLNETLDRDRGAKRPLPLGAE
ncbi:MAG TPA: hypothetical protein VF801_09290 [Rhodocyclaceae bacterium]